MSTGWGGSPVAWQVGKTLVPWTQEQLIVGNDFQFGPKIIFTFLHSENSEHEIRLQSFYSDTYFCISHIVYNGFSILK